MCGNIKAILLAAGLGLRLRPFTKIKPKCLLPIGGKPLLQYWLENLSKTCIREVLVNTHWLAEQVEGFIAEWNSDLKNKLRVITFHEPELLGSAGTILACQQWWENASELLIIYADNFTMEKIDDILIFHQFHNFPFTVGIFETEEPERCGIVSLNDYGLIVDFVEKPINPKTNLASAGIYVADTDILKNVLECNEKFNRPYDLGHHVLPKLTGRMMAYRLKSFLIDIGTPESYMRAQKICAGEIS